MQLLVRDLNKVVLRISILQEGGEGECKMNKAHLPAEWDVWLLDEEHWLLLSPDLGSTVAGVSAPTDSVGPSLVAVPVLSHTRGHSCCTGFLGSGQGRHMGTPEMVQDAPRSEHPAMLPVVQENCFQALLVCILTYQEEHVRSTACFHARHFHHLLKQFISVVCKFFRWLVVIF